MPQFQAVSGGPGTNRGYPVSVAAGDNAVNFTGEYRFHVPRSFAVQPQPGTLFGEPFRYAPQRMYGRADWDLMLLGFVDYSWLTKNDKIALHSETDQTLISAGVGFEFQFKRNMRVRLDWGWALRSLEGGLYDAGHNRVYVQASLSF
jgi:hemolysin activation/secretion protein